MKSNLRIWEDPPDLRCPLVIVVMLVWCSSVVLLVLGAVLAADPALLLFMDWADDEDAGDANHSWSNDTSVNESMTSLRVCQSSSVDLCPTVRPSDIQRGSEFAFTYNHITVPILLTSVLDFTAAVGAIISILCGQKAFLAMTMFIIPLTMTLRWILVDLIVFIKTPYHEESQDNYVLFFRSRFKCLGEGNPFTRIYNSVMMHYGCCGVRSPHDSEFAEPFIHTESETVYTLYQPASCCVNSSATSDDHVIEVINGSCYTQYGDSWPVNQKGCFALIFEMLYDRYGRYVVVLLIASLIFQSLQNLLTICVLLKPSRQEIEVQSKASSRGPSVNPSKAVSLQVLPGQSQATSATHVTAQSSVSAWREAVWTGTSTTIF